ncbi:YciI family protein [Enterobacter hormaechei]
MIYAEDVPDSLENVFPFALPIWRVYSCYRIEGRLLTAGPMPAVDSNHSGAAGFTGSTVIAEFESLEAAQAWDKQTCTSQPACTRKSRFVRIKKYLKPKAPSGAFSSFSAATPASPQIRQTADLSARSPASPVSFWF